MTVRRTMTTSEKEYAMGCLRASAADNDGKPDWGAVAQMTDRDAKVLRRLWLAEGQGSAPQRAAVSEVPTSADALDLSDVGYWRFRWLQIQAELARAESDVARQKLTRDQDDIRARYRDAVAVESKKSARTREEVVSNIETMIDALPASLAQVAADRLRARGLAR